MEKFDIDKFKKHKKGVDWKFTQADGVAVWQFETGSGYIERTQNPSSPYAQIKAYDAKGNLIAKSTEFYSIPVGKLVYFDPKTGQITKEDNYEKYFKFSIDDLAKKMKQDYHFDIMNQKDTFTVSRTIDQSRNSESYYQVYQKKDKANYMVYLVDGQTGKVVYEMTLPTEGDRRLIYDEYLKSRR